MNASRSSSARRLVFCRQERPTIANWIVRVGEDVPAFALACDAICRRLSLRLFSVTDRNYSVEPYGQTMRMDPACRERMAVTAEGM